MENKDTNEFMDGDSAFTAMVQLAIVELETTSIAFQAAWLSTPQDLQKAREASSAAMKSLDQLIDKILHARNKQMAKNQYAGSQLQSELNRHCGVIVSNVTSQQQKELVASGPGNGVLSVAGAPIEFEALLVKMLYRQEQAGNFRIDNGRHIFLVNVDKKDRTPDCILEFDVMEFCTQCRDVAKYLY